MSLTKTERLIRGLAADGWVRDFATKSGKDCWTKDLQRKDGTKHPCWAWVGGNASLRIASRCVVGESRSAPSFLTDRLIALG